MTTPDGAESTSFTKASRKRLLKQLAEVSLGDPKHSRKLMELTLRYVNELPRVRVSRCPHTNAEVVHSLDAFGLDGPWWDYELPARPNERLPDTYHALTGAVHINGDVEHTECLVRPGPAVPFVVPRILDRDGVIAVISHVKVGEHDAYPVFYFTDRPVGPPGFNTWARDKYQFFADGERRWNSADEELGAIDFDLAPWIDRGKLRWIGTGDDTLTLRDVRDGCPYLDVEGPRQFQSIRFGQRWLSPASR